MGHPDYPLTEFASRLANVEEKYAKEIQSLVECFCCSRLDLPVKKLEDLTRVRLKTARHLKKIDDKKGELIALWKVCNIYSATAVDVDEAMRDIRRSLRKRLKPVPRDTSAFKRFVDEYRPANKRSDPPQEIYDMNKPNLKEKQRFMDLFKKKESKKAILQDAEQSYTQHLVDSVKANFREEGRKNVVVPPPPPPIPSVAAIPVEPKKEEDDLYGEFMPRLRKEEGKTSLGERKSIATMEKKPQLPPVAPPRKTMTRAQSAIDCSNEIPKSKKSAAPPIPPRESAASYAKQLTTVPPTVIQLEWQQTNRNHDNKTTIQMEDVSSCFVPPSPQLTIRVSDDDSSPSAMVTPAPRLTNGRIYKYHPQSQPARPVLKAQMISIGDDGEEDEDSRVVVDRL